MESPLSFLSGVSLAKLFFALLFLGYWLFAFFIVYHLTRFGIGSKQKIMALVFFVGSACLFLLVATTYYQVELPQFNNWEDFKLNLDNLPRPSGLNF